MPGSGSAASCFLTQIQFKNFRFSPFLVFQYKLPDVYRSMIAYAFLKLIESWLHALLFCECTHLWSVVDFRRLLQRKPWADEAIGSSLQDIAKPAGLIATAVRDFQLPQRSFSPASAERSASRTPLDELYHFFKNKTIRMILSLPIAFSALTVSESVESSKVRGLRCRSRGGLVEREGRTGGPFSNLF